MIVVGGEKNLSRLQFHLSPSPRDIGDDECYFQKLTGCYKGVGRRDLESRMRPPFIDGVGELALPAK